MTTCPLPTIHMDVSSNYRGPYSYTQSYSPSIWRTTIKQADNETAICIIYRIMHTNEILRTYHIGMHSAAIRKKNASNLRIETTPLHEVHTYTRPDKTLLQRFLITPTTTTHSTCYFIHMDPCGGKKMRKISEKPYSFNMIVNCETDGQAHHNYHRHAKIAEQNAK